MNRVTLYGNVGKDPESKQVGESTVTKFSLATNRTYNNKAKEKVTETEWHNIILWGKVAEIAAKYVKKGSSVIIEGEIRYRSYENKDGQTVYITEILGNNLTLVGKPPEGKPENNEGKFVKDSDSLGSAEDDPSYDPFG